MKWKGRGLFISNKIVQKLIEIGGSRMVKIVDAIVDYHSSGVKPTADAPKEVRDIFDEWLRVDGKHNYFKWQED